MINRMSVKDMWKYCVFQAKGYSAIKYLLIIGAVSGASVAYVNSFLYAGLLNSLMEGKYAQASDIAVVLVTAVFVLEILSKASRRIFDHYTWPSSWETGKRTARKAFSIEYGQMEDPATLQSFRRVRQGENGHGGILNQLQAIYSFYKEMATVVFACVFVAALLGQSDFDRESVAVLVLSTAVLAAVFAGVLAIGVRVSDAIGKLELDMNHKNEKYNTLGAYLLNLVYSEKWGQDIRFYNMKDYFCRKMKPVIDVGKTYVRFGRITAKKEALMAFLLQVLAGAAYVYIAIKAMAGSISAGEVMMYAGAVITMMNSIRRMMSLHIDINYSNEYLKTYEEFINRPNMHYEGTLPIEKRVDNRYELKMQHVSFKYPGTEQFILRDVSVEFSIGERLALVGKNGAGKTTLIKLLLRLYEPTEGEILLNGINIGKYDYDEYMKIFSVVFQDYQLFRLPLDENIAGSGEVDEKRVNQVLAQVGLAERVKGMKDGAHTLLYHETGDGEGLSGGEAQKAAIARALYKNAPFVILDEPTAALDPLAEAEIYENFDGLVGGKTSIYISHRMSSCKFCDRIIVMDEGRIVEEGNHDSLLGQRGIYAELYEAQAQYYK